MARISIKHERPQAQKLPINSDDAVVMDIDAIMDEEYHTNRDNNKNGKLQPLKVP